MGNYQLPLGILGVTTESVEPKITPRNPFTAIQRPDGSGWGEDCQHLLVPVHVLVEGNSYCFGDVSTCVQLKT